MSGHTKDPIKRYRNWHWGIDPSITVDWTDRDLPDELIEIGRLVNLHFNRGRGGADEILNVVESKVNQTHLCFDPAHKYQRLYVLIPSQVAREVKRKLWSPGAKSYSLAEIAKMTDGKHSKMRDYPRVAAQPIGHLTHVTYLTHKKGDGVSNYIHELGEVNGNLPILAVDAKGRLWIVGGDYVCPVPGITN
jgi:hypothetical protein